jgi:hypothetical protein
MELLILQFSPASLHFLPLYKGKYFYAYAVYTQRDTLCNNSFGSAINK